MPRRRSFIQHLSKPAQGERQDQKIAEERRCDSNTEQQAQVKKSQELGNKKQGEASYQNSGTGQNGHSGSDEGAVQSIFQSRTPFPGEPTEEVDAYSIAQASVGLEHDRKVAKARLQALRAMLEEAEMYIDGV